MTDGDGDATIGSDRPAARRELLARARKLLNLLGRREYRRALRHRVAATVEHAAVPFKSDFASVIDVGANQGQFAVFASVRFPRAHLYCVEPQEDARARLCALVPAERLTVFPYAVGDRDHVALFHLTHRADSSSLRPPTDTAGALFAGVETSGTQEVHVQRLDDLLASGKSPPAPVLLKMDVQGGEYEALLGAEQLLTRVDTVLVEASFEELYAGQKLAGSVVTLLEAQGFAWKGVYSLRTDQANRCVQCDLLFERPSA